LEFLYIIKNNGEKFILVIALSIYCNQYFKDMKKTGPF